MKEELDYILHLGDNALILGQRLGELCGHGPILEQDMAMTNIALDFIGQSRNLYQYAAELEGKGRTEDDLAFLRDTLEYKNLLLVEQDNGDFAMTILRQFFYDAYNFHLYQKLCSSTDQRLAAIAQKAIKEITYHLKWSSEWVIRLADGTDESRTRILKALDHLWPFVGELTTAVDYEKDVAKSGKGVDSDTLRDKWLEEVNTVFNEANLELPDFGWMQKGGKTGVHTEQLGFILADMQFLQRVYPGQEW